MFKIVKSSTWTNLQTRFEAELRKNEMLNKQLEDFEKKRDLVLNDLRLQLHETKMALETCKTRRADIQKDADLYQKTLSKANEEIAERLQEIKLLKARIEELGSRKCPVDANILLKTKTRLEGALKELNNVNRGRKSPTKTKVQTILSQSVAELKEALK